MVGVGTWYGTPVSRRVFARRPVGDVTELFKRVAEGDPQAQGELYDRTKSELRKLALHWINRKRAKGLVRTTDVIDRAFVKLMRIPSPDWPHRGAFYVYASRNILCTVIDGRGPRPRRPRFDLRLMSWGDGTGVPTSGNELVITGTDDNDLLHIRIFDQDGHRVTDTDEAKLPHAQAQAILILKQRLPGLLPPHVMTEAEKAQILREVTSIVGQTRRRPDAPLPVELPAPVKGLTKHRLLTLKEALVDLEQDLSETHREVVELRFLGKCTLDEVGELLSISRDKVFKMSKVALEYLRERLGPSFPEFG
jgi:RNA polymerase sigma factor (sigma-70 family)